MTEAFRWCEMRVMVVDRKKGFAMTKIKFLTVLALVGLVLSIVSTMRSSSNTRTQSLESTRVEATSAPVENTGTSAVKTVTFKIQPRLVTDAAVKK